MAKKSVDASLAAYKSKGMKAPRPEAGPKLDQSSPPKHKPSMQHKEPSGPYSKPDSGGKAPAFGEQSKKPDHKKKALPSKDAPAGVSGVNGGSSMNVNDHYCNPLKKD